MARLRVPVTPLDHIRGPADAPVTLIEYGDYECPHCGAGDEMVKELQKHFPGRLRSVFRHFPLYEVHPNAEAAAQSAEFAAAHGRFWEMHDSLYQNQDRLGLPLLFELANDLGLPEAELRRVLDAGEYAQKIRDEVRSGVRSGVNGTPTFFIDEQRFDGPLTFDEFVAAIESRLDPKPPKPSLWSRWFGRRT
jgi:protein-disulfide isomerase